jgi:hypothetical protein
MYLEAFQQQRRSPEIRISPDNNALTTSETAQSAPPTGLPVKEDLKGGQQTVFNSYDPSLEGQPHSTTSFINCRMAEVRNIITARGIDPDLIRVAPYPTEDITTQAVEDFLNSTGALFQLWHREEAITLTKSVYQTQDDITTVHTTEVFAMAAVKSFCDREIGDRFFRERYLDICLYLLSSTSTIPELCFMRLFVCLAIIRFANNVGSARNLMCESLAALRSYA